MADPADLFKALPYGLFDKRTWSPKARDDFNKQLLEEEATRLYDRQSKLQAESAAQQREIQKAYQQTAYDLAQAKDTQNRDRYRKGLYDLKQAETLKTVPDINPEELAAIANLFADQGVAGMDAGFGAEAAKKGIGAVQTLGSEPDIAAARARGELAQEQLRLKRDNSALENFAAEEEAAKLARKAKTGIDAEVAKNPMLGMPHVLSLITSYNNALQRTPVLEADAAKKNAETDLLTEKVKKIQEEAAFAAKMNEDNTPTGRPKGALPVFRPDANGVLQPEGVSNAAPTRVYDAPGSLKPLIPPYLLELINRTNRIQ